MNRKKLLAIGGSVVAVAALAYYAASPYLAFHSLRSAAERGDRDRLERLVDFPAVRESLKSQLLAAMSQSMQNDPEMRDNPFAGMAMLMIPGLVNNAIDVYVTADGLANMVEGRPPAAGGEASSGRSVAGPSEATPDAEVSMGYSDLNTFRVEVDPLDGDATTLVMRRNGVFAWQLKRIELPDDLMAD